MAEKRLEGKVALITGAAGGIGSVTAKLFAQHGATLSLLDIDAIKLQSVARECDKISAVENTLTFVGDISDEKCCQDYVENTVEKFGRVDILINCAGIVKRTCVDELQIDVFDEVMAVNIRAVVALSSIVIPHLKRTQGNIVSISSTLGHRSFDGMVAYGISKAAVHAYTRYAASELAEFKIRVNCISPGGVDTPIVHNPLASAEANIQFLENLVGRHAIGRIGHPNEIAQSILFLASDVTASFITGTDLVVDGGFCVHYGISKNVDSVLDK